MPTFYRDHRGVTNSDEILTAVKRNQLFGMVEVDIHVPENLYNTFDRMCPLFGNTEVNFADIGETMQDFAEQHGLLNKPRRLLVGGMAAKRMLLSTDLLKWCLDHGLEVDFVHQVVEYTPVACFRSFVDDVTQARRDGDIDLELKVIADTMKLIGNSSYGSVIMAKEKFRDVKYFGDVWRAQLAINDPAFYGMDELGDELFEITMAKRKIRLDLPIQIGFQILQLAKQRMLEFYYDCLAKRFDSARFDLIEMDTDSNYFAI